MVYCNQCGKQIVEDSKFCSHCGNKNVVASRGSLESNFNKDKNSILADVRKVKVSSERKSSKFKTLSIILIGIVLILGGGYYYSIFISKEGQAKNVVSHYLKASKNGTSTVDYKKDGVDDFINVLDYKFLNASDPTEGDTEVTYTSQSWENLKKFNPDDPNIGNSFNDFKKYLLSLINHAGGKMKVITENDDEFKYSTGEKYDTFSLLFDVQVTNGLGQSVFKKVKFIVDNNDLDKKFEITSYE